MTDVAYSVSLDQQRFNDPVVFPSQHYFIPTTSTFATTQHFNYSDSNPGSYDFEVADFDIQSWFASMSSQQSNQALPNSSQPQQYPSIDAQQAMLHPLVTPFVQPTSGYYSAQTSTASNLPFSNVQNSVSNYVATTNASISNHRGYSGGVAHNHYQQQQQHIEHLLHSQRTSGSQLLTTGNFGQSTQTNTDYNNSNVVSNHRYLPQRIIYAGAIPSSTVSSRQQHQQQKSIPTNIPQDSYSRQCDSTMASPTLFSPTNGRNNNTVNLPMFGSNNNTSSAMSAWTAKTTTAPTTITIPQNNLVSSPIHPNSSPETSPTTPTYSYSGPPRSYYSRLPLYDRPFKCDQCPQSFNRNHDLKRHKRIHLAVKPYPCMCCDKQFSRKDALKRHILVKGCNNTVINNNNNNNDVSSSSTTNVTGNEQIMNVEESFPTLPTINEHVGSSVKSELSGDQIDYYGLRM